MTWMLDRTLLHQCCLNQRLEASSEEHNGFCRCRLRPNVSQVLVGLIEAVLKVLQVVISSAEQLQIVVFCGFLN